MNLSINSRGSADCRRRLEICLTESQPVEELKRSSRPACPRAAVLPVLRPGIAPVSRASRPNSSCRNLVLAACAAVGFGFHHEVSAQSFGTTSVNQEVFGPPSGGDSLFGNAPGTLSNVVGDSSTSVTVNGGDGTPFPITGTLTHSSNHTAANTRTNASAGVTIQPGLATGLGRLTITYTLQANGSGGAIIDNELTSESEGAEGYATAGLSVQNNPDNLLTRIAANGQDGNGQTVSDTVSLVVRLDQPISISISGESRSTVATPGSSANAASQCQVSFTLVPAASFVWQGGQEGGAFSHGGNWQDGQVPGAQNPFEFGNTTSMMLLDMARSHPGISMSAGGDHLFVLNGHTFGIGAEGVAITGGRLTVSNGTFNAAGQNTLVGSAAAIPSRLVVSQGGAGTTFNTGNLLVGHTGDGEVQIGNATVNVGTVLTLGATPNAKGILRMDRGGLDVTGGAAIGIPPGASSQIIAGNESSILWNSAAVATFDHESLFEARDFGTLSVGGKFVFRGGSNLKVGNQAGFYTFSGADALVLDGSTAEFDAGSKGGLGDVHLKNDALMILANNSEVDVKNLILADEGEAMVAVLDSSLTVTGDRVQLAAEAPNTRALLTVADGRIELDVDFVFLGMDKGAAEIFVSEGGTMVYPGENLIQVGGGTADCNYTVLSGGKSQGGNFVFVDKSSLRVEDAGSTFQAAETFFDAAEPRFFDLVSADFRKGSASHLGKTVMGISNIKISEGATVTAETLKLDGATILMNGSGSLLEAAATGTVDAPSMFLLLDEGCTFKGGTLVMGGEASVLGKGTLAFTTVNNNGGLISPGSSPGILTVNGSLHQSAGRIVLEIGGTEPGVTHDQLVITEDFNFTGGVIELVFTDRFAPQAGQVFELMNIGGDSTGTPVVNVHGLEPDWDFSIERDPQTGVLKLNSLSNGTPSPIIRVLSFAATPAAGGEPGKRITASVMGPPGWNVLMESTEDLVHWTPVVNGAGVFNGSGHASFDLTDTEATGSRRFYRFGTQ